MRVGDIFPRGLIFLQFLAMPEITAHEDEEGQKDHNACNQQASLFLSAGGWRRTVIHSAAHDDDTASNIESNRS